jgi:hypothetical protein
VCGQTDGAGGESIVYVSEPQPLAHSSEEVIDMVENPVSSDVQAHVQSVNEGGPLHQAPAIPPNAAALTISEPVELQPQSITLGSTLLEHLLMSLNETKKKLDQQEELTRQAIQRAEEAEKEISICKSRLTVLELAMQQQVRAGNSGLLSDSLISPPSISLALPLINSATAITVPVATSALSVMTSATEDAN